jgi:signal transduction histidine kinase
MVNELILELLTVATAHRGLLVPSRSNPRGGIKAPLMFWAEFLQNLYLSLILWEKSKPPKKEPEPGCSGIRRREAWRQETAERWSGEMHVCLVSGDTRLQHFVSEIVGSGLSSLAPGEALVEADFYVFDFQPAYIMPRLDGPNFGNHLFLVDPKDLPAFGQQISGTPGCILLKPFARRTFEAFLDSFRQSWEARFNRQQAERFRSERDELLQHLLQANLSLQEYDQERTRFLARALHDFRTPLMSLRGICGLLLEGEVGPLNDQQKELLQRIENSSARLARLSSGMFELSIEGRVQRSLRFEPGDIESCIRGALHEVSAFVREKQLLVDSHATEPPKTMYMESQRIEQLLINLLENACKFTPRGGKIEVLGYSVCWNLHDSSPKSASGLPNAYRIDVRDSGPGIEPHMLEAIFEQYTPAVGFADRSGGGLGLAICKLAAEGHKGRVWATSSREGAVFSVVLPFDPRPAEGRLAHMSTESRQRSARAV